MFLLGLFRLAALVRYVPLPIVIGVTNGIGVLQLRDLLGLQVPGKLPADFLTLLQVRGSHLASFNPWALALGGTCVAGRFFGPLAFKPGVLLRGAGGHPAVHGLEHGRMA